ncbi:hypothetical protein N7G274_009223 [Stereocaulon virgatum]|uniref:F-box domain-containing protein n=1 Tax=Stereocaulon virgatum TaxID=373712 RepID=A0ABR4A3T9_9LECA
MKMDNDDYRLFKRCFGDAEAKCDKHRLPKLSDSPEVASTQVFHIPELLEMILLHVPELPLLVFQRVNKVWRDVIQTSSPLQRKLFMEAEPISFKDMWVNYDTIHLRWNPFVLKYANPHSRRIAPYPSVDFGRNILRKFNDPDASWRKMFVSQPAGSTFCLTYLYDVRGDPVRVKNLIVESRSTERKLERCADITMDGMATLTRTAHDKRVLISVQIRVETKRAHAG